MAPVIRISDELYGRLEALARGFDTPANVIERLLGNSEPEPPASFASIEMTQDTKRHMPSSGFGPRRIGITPEMTKLTGKLGDKIYKGDMRIQDAQRELIRIGMNPASAMMYLMAYRSMLVGEVFKCGMKTADSRRMFSHIKRKYGMGIFSLAIKAYALHLRHLEADGYSVGNKHRFLAEMKAEME